MTRTTHRILSALLVLVLAVSLAVPALAVETVKVTDVALDKTLVTLAPGEYALVWCEKGVSGPAEEIWAPFGLSSKGGSVLLSSFGNHQKQRDRDCWLSIPQKSV